MKDLGLTLANRRDVQHARDDYKPRQRVARFMLAVYLGQPMVSFAQIVAAPTVTDSRRPYIDQTQNGLPKVNIATPNGSGVSHNVYQDFNVAKQGAILNNGATNSNTRLAGWVEGNPNLKPGQEAKLILNEVIGGKLRPP